MSDEVFAYPTVKQVIFQITFPSMFSIDSKIGEFQDKIIGKFPESNQVFHRQIIFADTGAEGKIETFPQGFSPQSAKKIYQFKSTDKIEVDVQMDSLVITSQEYKSYNNPNSEKRFKEIIEFVLNNFLQTINIPIIKRIGLRYSDECPLPKKDNETIKRLYNSTILIDKFDVSNTESMYFNIVTTRKNHKLI